MRIERLILQNIGVYVNKNVFDLQADRPIILVGGMNGRGKTTFLEAVLLALYGKRSGELIQGNRSFEEYLKSISNMTGDSDQCSVEICFVMDMREPVRYRVKRSWKSSGPRLKLLTQVDKNGIRDTALSENWDLFIEEILPHGIAPFFFFDGEKIASLAASKDDGHLRTSVMALLGIDIIEQLIADLQMLCSIRQKSLAEDSYKTELQNIELHLEEERCALGEGQSELERRQKEYDTAIQRLTALNNEFSALGGGYAEQRKKLEGEKQRLLLKKEECQNALRDLAGADLPLGMVLFLVNDIYENAKQEAEQLELRIFLKQFAALSKDYEEKDSLNVGMEDFLLYVRKKVKESSPVYILTEEERERLSDLRGLIRKEADSAKDYIQIIKDTNKRIEEIENYLVIQVDDKRLEEILAQTLQLTSQKEQLEADIRMMEEELKSHEAALEHLEKARKQILKNAADELDAAEENLRVILYAQKQIDILRVYKEQLQMQKTDGLARQMTECIRKLMAKDGLIQKILIDPKSLEFSYYNKNGQKINKMVLSSGEKQLLVIAMLWALGICANSEFPLIIDTPLARLDSVHRASLIRNYFPYASDQVIILSTDQEITQQDYDLLKPYVGKEFTLIYNEQTMSSSIQSGYFGGNGK